MLGIEENTEKLDLLEKTKALELRQKKRVYDMDALVAKEKEAEKERDLLDGKITAASASILDQEDAHRNMLVHNMNVQANANDNLKPVVKVLNNVQGTMGKMRRNHENTHEIVRANHYELKSVKQEVTEMRSDIAEVTAQIKKSTFNNIISGADMSDFFPVTRPQQLIDFMDKTHPEWPSRRTEFFSYLYNCISDSKKTFTKGLLKTLFSRPYMCTVKWPTFGYDHVYC